MKFSPLWPTRVPNAIRGFPRIMHPFDDDWQLIVCVCFCACVSVWVCVRACECAREKTVVTTISVELNHGSLLAWVRCYRNGMPGSDITFLAWSFHHESAKSIKPLEVCSCGLTDDSKHIDVRSMHCVSIVAECVDSLWAFRKCLRRRSLIWNQPLITLPEG